MRITSAIRTTIAGLWACLALSACVPSLDGQETRFYVLGTLPAGTESVSGADTANPLTVDLASVTIPQYLQRPQIVTRVSANQLALSEFDNWGGSLEKNMLRSLASNLSTLLATPKVHIAARRVPTDTHARLEVEVMAYERGPDNRVRLEAQWRLVGGDRERAPLVSRVTLLTSEPLSDSGMAATVSAMTTLLGEFSAVVADAIVSSTGK